MSRAADIYGPQLNDHFNSLFGEQYQDTELKEVFEEAFTTYAPDDGVLEGELSDSFEMMLYDAWETRFEGSHPAPEREVKAVADAMASYVVEEMVRTEAPVNPNFQQSREVSEAYNGFYQQWSKAENYIDDENWVHAQPAVYQEAEELAFEETQSTFDEYEYTATGDATEMVKDHIAEDPEEYMDLVEALDIDVDEDDMYAMASAKKWGKKPFRVANVTMKKAELDSQVRIYIADLAAYNDGKLIGEWVDLPADEEELEEIMDRLSHGGNQDTAIHDYEAPFRIEEFESPFALNEAVEAIEASYVDFDVIACVKDDIGYTDWEEAISAAEDASVIDISDRYGSMPANPEENLGYHIVDEVYGGIEQMSPEQVEMYFDYESFGRDASMELYEDEDQEYYDQFRSDREYGESLIDDMGGPSAMGETASR
jgi:hypothetical protein